MRIMALIFLVSLFLGIYICYLALKTLFHYNEARKLNIPILLAPVTWQSPLWMIFHHRLIPILSHLPFNLGAWTHYSTLGWTLKDHFATHARLGPIFGIVSPEGLEIMVADPTAADILISRWRIWTKSPVLYRIFEVFGKNVNTVNGNDWQRPRKITGVAFNEPNNALVWAESWQQARGMFTKWNSELDLTIAGVVEDTAALALHVLSSAALGHSYPFGKGLQMPRPGHKMSYGEAVRILMENIMATLLVGSVKVPKWLLPPGLKRLTIAVAEFKAYMAEGVQEEKDAIAAGRVNTRHNLLSSVTRASEIADKEEAEKSQGERRSGLSDEELYGNLFMFNVAGHETTANTFSYVIPLLAAHPEIQDWVCEEIDEVFGPYDKDSSDDTPPDYEAAFPRLKRCMSLMYEQLRIYGALQVLSKDSGPSSQPLTIKFPSTGAQKTYLVPPNIFVSVNFAALHIDPAHWGPDALAWKPKRWISSPNPPTPHSSVAATLASETFNPPPTPASFVPWSGGPRVCPGKKFSQVEFVAVLSYLLRRHRVQIARLQGEGEGAARERASAVIKDSELVLTPKITRAASVGLVWVER